MIQIAYIAICVGISFIIALIATRMQMVMGQAQLRPRSQINTYLNSKVTETVANTLVATPVEFPNTAGASGVFVTGFEVDTEAPDIEASQNNFTAGALMLGYHTIASMPMLDTTGVLTFVQERIQADASAIPTFVVSNSPWSRQGLIERVPKHTDGKFYFVPCIKGTGNANTKNFYFRIEYLVIR